MRTLLGENITNDLNQPLCCPSRSSEHAHAATRRGHGTKSAIPPREHLLPERINVLVEFLTAYLRSRL
ncbi:MAG: hypothetical protein KDA69_20615 [Planctomycetaceae bacterium]|nr:hypothetical protein [Planctomycetaceae bacterium]